MQCVMGGLQIIVGSCDRSEFLWISMATDSPNLPAGQVVQGDWEIVYAPGHMMGFQALQRNVADADPCDLFGTGTVAKRLTLKLGQNGCHFSEIFTFILVYDIVVFCLI